MKMLRYSLAGLCAGCLLSVAAVATAQDQPQSGKLLTFDVVIAEVPEGVAPASPTAAAILEMEKAGKLSGFSRFRLSSLENQKASIQFGEQAPMVTGRNIGGGGRGGPGGGFPSSTSYSTVSVGTLVNTVARVESADAIVVDLKIQQSSLTPQKPADPADPNAFTPQTIVTFNIDTTVRSKPGEPLLLTGRQLQSGKEATQTWVVLTSHIAAAPAQKAAAPAEKKTGAVAPEAEETIKVFQLVNGSAPAMANVLTGILPREGVRIAVDERTNTLLMRGDPGNLEVARALISRLDMQK